MPPWEIERYNDHEKSWLMAVISTQASSETKYEQDWTYHDRSTRTVRDRGSVSLRLPEPGDGTPGCPGVPTTTLAPPTFSPRCAWAQTGYEESGGDGGFFNNIQECPIDGSSPTTQRYINNRPAAASYVFPADFEEVCLMFYKRQGGNQATCKEVCEALGSTCNVELAGIGASGTDKCNTGLGKQQWGQLWVPW